MVDSYLLKFATSIAENSTISFVALFKLKIKLGICSNVQTYTVCLVSLKTGHMRQVPTS